MTNNITKCVFYYFRDINRIGHILKAGALLMLIFVISGCSRSIKPPSSFTEDGGRIALIWSADKDHGTHRKEGAQGLLDVMVNEALKGGLPGFVETITVEPLAQKYYLDPYGKKLQTEGFDVNVLKLPVEKATLRDGSFRDNKKNRKSQINLIPFGKEHNVKYVLHLDVVTFGSLQNYFGFVPMGDPKGDAKIKLTLVDTSDNTILARFSPSITIKPDGDWNGPPTYSVMTSTIYKAFEKALSDAYFGLFEDDDYGIYLEDSFELDGGL
jgi:hypothetical protein